MNRVKRHAADDFSRGTVSFSASLRLATVAIIALAVGVAVETGPARGQSQIGSIGRLMNPAALTAQAPDVFEAALDTTAGSFVIQVHRQWAPHGADRFYNLVKSGFYDGNRFYQVTSLVAAWGLNGDPAVAKAWLGARIPDDPTSVHSNVKGAVAFFEPDKRTTLTFVNLADNSTMLDFQITPFGEVVSGMDVVEKLYAGYGDSPPNGNGPDLNRFYKEGNAYLAREFPKLDYIRKATVAAPQDIHVTP
jgi:peptidyl-prolyl cis-trans isomerase A (cyclophilin A)